MENIMEGEMLKLHRFLWIGWLKTWNFEWQNFRR